MWKQWVCKDGVCARRETMPCVFWGPSRLRPIWRGRRWGASEYLVTGIRVRVKSHFWEQRPKLEPANSRRLHYSVTARGKWHVLKQVSPSGFRSTAKCYVQCRVTKGPLTQREDASRVPWGPVETWLRAWAPAEILESWFWVLPVKNRWARIHSSPQILSKLLNYLLFSYPNEICLKLLLRFLLAWSLSSPGLDD